RQLISRLSSSSVALIGLGWLITRPNDPLSPCSIISTTAREKFGSASCGIARSKPGARDEDSTSSESCAIPSALPLKITGSVSISRELVGKPGVGRAVLRVDLVGVVLVFVLL